MLCTFMCCFHETMELRVHIVGKHVICSDSVGQLQWYFYTISWFLTIEKIWKNFEKNWKNWNVTTGSWMPPNWKKIKNFDFFNFELPILTFEFSILNFDLKKTRLNPIFLLENTLHQRSIIEADNYKNAVKQSLFWKLVAPQGLIRGHPCI